MSNSVPHAPIRPALAIALLASLAACASMGTPADQASASDLWGRISAFKSWGQFAGHTGIQKGHSPHGKFVSTHINAIAAQSPDKLPIGSVVVKANFSKESWDALDSLTVMEKIEGYDPENGDWFWARYTPQGELTHSGKVAMCADCHLDAGNEDFVFLNDQ